MGKFKEVVQKLIGVNKKYTGKYTRAVDILKEDAINRLPELKL